MERLTYRAAPGRVICAAAALALACAAPAFGAEAIIDRDGAAVETVLTGKVGEVEDVISVVLPSNIKMTIKTDEEGRLDEAGTRENESRSTKAVRLALYETTDDQRLLDEVVLSLNGQNIKQAVGGASGEVLLTGSIRPGEADTLTMSASPIGPAQTISAGTRSVRTVIKATVS